VAGLQTEYPFTLPKGYVDADGALHRHGIMRMATARDEIEPLRDARINSSDDPYLTVLVLARVVTELGSLPKVTTNDVEGLFAADLAFLQDLYGSINFGDPADVAALQATVPPDEASPAAPEPEILDAEMLEPAVADDTSDDYPTPSTSRRGRIEEVPSRSSS
jgi:hypothetical protein